MRTSYYVNKRNENKVIEVRRYDCGHYAVRSFMMWGSVINLLGDRCLHRWNKGNLDDLLVDYRLAM